MLMPYAEARMLKLMPRRRLFMNAALVSDNVDGTHNCRCASSSHVACITWLLGERAKGMRYSPDVPEINLTQPQKRNLLWPSDHFPLSRRNHYLFLFLPVSHVYVCECVHFG